MKKVKVSELTGTALDWAVAVCEGYTDLHKIAGRRPHEPQLGIWPPRREYGVMDLWELCYSTDWAQGGPLIERHIFRLEDGDGVEGWPDRWVAEGGGSVQYGPTALIAAMRAYVESKLGSEIEIPEVLV